MGKYIVKRVILAIFTIFIISLITFFAMNAIPGGPFNSEKANHQAAEEKSCPQVHMECSYMDRELYIEISDNGVGIQDVARAMEPLYTSKPQLDRSGMGFSFMEAFMDALTVTSEPGHGTTVKMKKIL